MAEITGKLAEFVSTLQAEGIPRTVRDRAALLTLDAVAIAVRAMHDGDSTPSLLAGFRDAGAGPGPCTVAGHGTRLAPAAAAGLNGALVHTLDFDDTHIGASAHITAPVVPAALATAEAVDADGEATIVGIVAGMEVMARLGRALVPPRHYARGYHPTATSGVFGATAAAGAVMGLSAEQMTDAFGIALSSAGGTLQFHANGAWTKRLQVGLAAEAGVRAAFLARAGFRGAAEPIEGERGLLRVFTDAPEPGLAVKNLGTEWETLEIGVKPYPACRFAHAAIDALLDMRVDAGDVRSIHVGLSRKAIAAVGEPEARKRHARNTVDAQFSMYFLAAAALIAGGVRWDDYPRLIAQPEIDALADKVQVWHDTAIEALYPRRMAASVRVVLSDGRELDRVVESPSGEPDRFPDEAAFRQKAEMLTAPVLGDAGVERLCDAALALERVGPQALAAAMRPV
ncbi:2-methylcitrate dehydratase PrpD [Palleronia aestuarii]|uniref:2-methylcitrate dehydratase PrpD n=1 Tax=Palleronia aestuarii TaxID=568105 RepID=A0A2W7NPD7_9RHOB|nr:MmgE/PrpD family protein [Palleronia aestuarii]PZX15106.1 2-methylcitrate dehydratase PrpD [Palleronia aestuarii]